MSELRVSKSGYSLRVGWGDEKRIVAVCPGTSTTQHADHEVFKQWLLDCDRLIAGWNANPESLAVETAERAMAIYRTKAEIVQTQLDQIKDLLRVWHKGKQEGNSDYEFACFDLGRIVRSSDEA